MCEYGVEMVGVQLGWQCPVCKRVYAPFVRECSYCGINEVTNIGTGTDQPLIDWCRHTTYTGTGMPEITLNNTSIGSKTRKEELEKLRVFGWSQVGEDTDG